MKRITNIIFIAACLALLLIPLILTDRRENVVSEIDNRMLVDAPTFGKENYTKDLEAYLQDRIGLRDKMVNAYSVVNDRAFHELTHPIYQYGKEGYVFSGMHRNFEYNHFHRAFAETAKQLQDYCEARGAKFYVIFDPEKSSVYRRYLPEGINYDDSWVDEFCSYMDELGVNYVNSTKLLTEKSQTEQVYNKVYDAGHWNDLGCFYATNQLWELVNKDFPAVKPLDENEFEVTEVEAKHLTVSEFKISEMVPKFDLKQDYTTLTDNWKDEVYRDANHNAFLYRVNNSKEAEDYPDILFFQGSYYNRSPDFILSRAKTYVGIHNYQNIFNLPYYFNIFNPDIVLLDVAEYVMMDEYFSYSEMMSLDLNPPLTDSDNDFDLIQSDIKLELAPGKKVDKLTLSSILSDAKYAYLVTGDRVFDFTRNDLGIPEISTKHGIISKDSENYIYVIGDDGIKIRFAANIIEREYLTDNLNCSAGAAIDSSGQKSIIEFHTKLKDNVFNSITLQVFNAETNEFIDTICQIEYDGYVTGSYGHSLPTGKYRFVLKANSNLQDESVFTEAELTEGETYYYSINLTELDKTHAVIDEFCIYHLS